MINGVAFKELVTHTDERGYFREVIRKTDDFFGEGFAQWNHSLMHPGSAKAWHIHQRQVDWWYVVAGVLKVALYDRRPQSPSHRETMEFFMGDGYAPRVVKIPPGVAHGCKTVSGPVPLFYIVSGLYDATDEGRIAYDDSSIGYDWLAGPAIK